MSTIAFFGATGGCTNACLAYTLLNGYRAVALARTPSKLTTQLLQQPGLTPELLDKQLRIVQGDATDVEAVTKTLLVEIDDTSRRCTLVSSIISGIGGSPSMSFSRPVQCKSMKIRVPALPHVELSTPHITEQTTRALLNALDDIASKYFDSFEAYSAVAPRLTVISSMGLMPGHIDVPFLFRSFYAVVLAGPHADKSRMEMLLDAETQKMDRNLLSAGVVVVRPSLLTGDHLISDDESEKSGLKMLRVGTEKAPEVGYTVSRALVGAWIFEEVVKGGGEKWVGEKVMLTL